MKRFFTLWLLCGVLATPARADDAPLPDTLRAAQELSDLINVETIAQMSATMTAQIWPRIEQSLAAKIDAATLAELRAEFERSVTSFAAETTKSAPRSMRGILTRGNCVKFWHSTGRRPARRPCTSCPRS